MNSVINRKFRYTFSNATAVLVAVNCFVFLATYLLFPRLKYYLAMIPGMVIHEHAYWQFVTYMFVHGSVWHLFSNMLGLYIFGSAVEREVGTREFVLFYFVCGLGAVGLHFGVEYLQLQSFMEGAALGNQAALINIETIKFTPTVGASGAIYGVLIGYAMLFPSSKMTLLFPPVTLSAKWMVIIFAGIELLTGVTGKVTGVAHFAHLGGMLIGWLMILFWRKRGKLFDKNSF